MCGSLYASATSVVRYFYGGGRVLTLQDTTTAQSAGLLTATERDDASGGADFLERSETAYYPDGHATTYGNKPYITRTLGPSIRDSGGREIACSIGSGRCGSDADCTSGTVCILGQGGGACAVPYPTSSSDDPCLGSGTALCREGRCHQILTGTQYVYQDTGIAHVVTTSRIYADTNSNFPASVHTRTDTDVTDMSSEVVHQTTEQEGTRAIDNHLDPDMGLRLVQHRHRTLRGPPRLGNPRCFRIFRATGPYSIAAMTRRWPPQAVQRRASTRKCRRHRKSVAV